MHINILSCFRHLIPKIKIVKNPSPVLLYCTFGMYRPSVYSKSQRDNFGINLLSCFHQPVSDTNESFSYCTPENPRNYISRECIEFHRFTFNFPCFRVTAGYVLSLGTMMFIVLCDVQLRLFSDEMSYRITLAAVGVIALGCTGQYSMGILWVFLTVSNCFIKVTNCEKERIKQFDHFMQNAIASKILIYYVEIESNILLKISKLCP